jgi:DNA-binding winged helix-turn-helix (wHTH) protein
MEDLYNRLSMLKVLLNSHYGEGEIIKNVYEESYKIRKKIHSIKVRKEKIKRIFNG